PYWDRVQALPDRLATAPQTLPLDAEETAARDAFLRRHHGAPNIKDVIKIDPSALVVHQWLVVEERTENYRQQVSTTRGWIDATLAAQATPHQVQLKFGMNAMDVEVPHGEFVVNFSAGGFQVSELAKFVSVTRFDGRMLLHAGYHRSYARISG